MNNTNTIQIFFSQYKNIIQTGLEYNYSEKEIFNTIYKEEHRRFLLDTERFIELSKEYLYPPKVTSPRIKELNYVIDLIRKVRSKELEYGVKNEQQRQWVWHSEPNSLCPVCQERDGRIYNEKPEPAHSNCHCEFEEIDVITANKYKESYRENIRQRDGVVDNLRNNVKNLNDWKLNNEGEKVYYDPQSGKYKKLGECAKYVTNALEKGGIDLRQHQNTREKDYDKAYKYGEYLEKEKFLKIPEGKNYTARNGDVKIYQPYDAFEKDGKQYPASNKAGHMQMFDGEQWISDFKQGETPRNQNIQNGKDKGMYPSAGYENSNTPSQIYRYPKWQEWK